MKPLVLGDLEFESRLIMGTGKFSSSAVMLESVKASGAQIVTVALRRFNREKPSDDLLGPLMTLKGVTLMPNTSGARNAAEAVKAARLARELCGSRLIKVEIHPNPHHLLPDPIETYEAAKILAADGFLVMPYMPPDPVLAKRLEEVGCVSVMPLGSTIGSGNGIVAGGLLDIIISNSNIPVIVDAGLRAPSEAAAAMEAGCSAVLVNSAIAAAGNPPAMAAAFAAAVKAGVAACEAGLMARGASAVPTSPLTSFLG
ncbi:MAG: thiazole synthase [Kiritimatiellia bacterium]